MKGSTMITDLLAKLNSLIDAVVGSYWSVVDVFTNPLPYWYIGFGMLVIATLVIGFYLPWKWVRAFLGGVILLAGAYVMGGRHMYKIMQPRVEKARKRKREDYND